MLLDDLFECLALDKKAPAQYSRIYKIHKYWARKPWNIVKEYVGKYSKEGELVLDPFCGSGVTGLEAIVQNRNFYGIDLNPMAVKIAEGTVNSNVNLAELKADFSKIQALCEKEILKLYEIEKECPQCKGKLHSVHVVCLGPRKGKSKVYCPACGWKTKDYYDVDLACMKYEKEIPYWYPTVEMPKKFFKDRFSYKGISKVADFFSKRNLYALALLLHTIKSIRSNNEALLLLAFSNTVLHASKLKGENVRPMSVNNYWISNDYIDENVWLRFEDRFRNVYAGKEALLKRVKKKKIGACEVVNGSALNGNLYPVADYVFTDPPYGETIQYSELSLVWNAWLEAEYDNAEEIIINPAQEKGPKEFNALLNRSLDNIYASLKEDGYFTLCFANKEFRVWKEIILHCKALGFALDNVKIYDTYGCPYNKNWSKFSPKTDLYVTFRKSQADNRNTIDEAVSLEGIIDEIIEYMRERNVKMDSVKLYDVTVAVIIWNVFYNRHSFDVENFDMKKFCLAVEKKMQ